MPTLAQPRCYFQSDHLPTTSRYYFHLCYSERSNRSHYHKMLVVGNKQMQVVLNFWTNICRHFSDKDDVNVVPLMNHISRLCPARGRQVYIVLFTLWYGTKFTAMFGSARSQKKHFSTLNFSLLHVFFTSLSQHVGENTRDPNSPIISPHPWHVVIILRRCTSAPVASWSWSRNINLVQDVATHITEWR